MANKLYGLTTKKRIKDIMGLNKDVFDDYLDGLIYSVTDYIERRTGRKFLRTTYSNEVYDGETITGAYKQHLLLKNAPVIGSITSFEYDTGTPGTSNWVAFNVNDYKLDPNLGVVYVNLPQGKRNIRISYTAGYLMDFTNSLEDTHTLPLDISSVCERMVINLFKRRESEGSSSEGFETSTVTWNNEIIDPMSNRVIQMFRRSNFIA